MPIAVKRLHMGLTGSKTTILTTNQGVRKMKFIRISPAALLCGAGIMFGIEAAGNEKITESFDKQQNQNLWLVPAFKILPDGGINNSGCLFTDKTESGKMQIATYTLHLKPNTKYRATVCYKAENLKDGNGSKLFCIEFTNKGKYVNGAYYYKPIMEGKWNKIDLEFTSPAEFNEACAGFFLPKNAAGKIWWDNFSIEPVK